MSDYEDGLARDDYFERLDRIDEIMDGDPEYDREEAKRIAARDAGRFSGGNVQGPIEPKSNE